VPLNFYQWLRVHVSVVYGVRIYVSASWCISTKRNKSIIRFPVQLVETFYNICRGGIRTQIPRLFTLKLIKKSHNPKIVSQRFNSSKIKTQNINRIWTKSVRTFNKHDKCVKKKKKGDSALNNFYEMKNLDACGVDTVTFNVVSSSNSYVPFPFPSHGLWQWLNWHNDLKLQQHKFQIQNWEKN